MYGKVKNFNKHQITGRERLAAHFGVEKIIIINWIESGMPMVQKGTESRIDRKSKPYVFNVPDVFQWVFRTLATSNNYYKPLSIKTNRPFFINQSPTLINSSGILSDHIQEEELNSLLLSISTGALEGIPAIAFEAINGDIGTLNLEVNLSFSFVEDPEHRARNN